MCGVCVCELWQEYFVPAPYPCLSKPWNLSVLSIITNYEVTLLLLALLLAPLLWVAKIKISLDLVLVDYAISFLQFNTVAQLTEGAAHSTI